MPRLDDTVIFSATFEEHMEQLQAVFEHLKQHNLKLKPSKCKLFRWKVTYLGHVSSAELVNITSTSPMEIVCIDYLSLEMSKGGTEHVLVMTDHFSRYAQAFPTKNQTAKTATRVLFDNFIVHYDFPARIHSDQFRVETHRGVVPDCWSGKVQNDTLPPL